jgi:hypothetical protein
VTAAYRGDPLLAEIQKSGAVSFVVEVSDGSKQEVAMPKAGNRWSKLGKLFEQLAWTSVTCLDKDRKVLGIVKNEEYEDDDEDGGGRDDRDERLARIMSNLMTTTMRETTRMFETQMRGSAELVSTMTEGLRSVQESYTVALRMQSVQQVAETSQSPEVVEMAKMAMMFLASGKQPPPPQQPQTPPRQQQPVKARPPVIIPGTGTVPNG